MTSGPMPSPGTTAICFFWLTGWKIINSVGGCHFELESRLGQSPTKSLTARARRGSAAKKSFFPLHLRAEGRALAILHPGPFLAVVVGVAEDVGGVVHVSRLRVGQVGGVEKVERNSFEVGRDGGLHARLIA